MLFFTVALPITLSVMLKGKCSFFCFHRGTLVKVLENGKIVLKKIEKIKEGDLILKSNGTSPEFAKVQKVEIGEEDCDFLKFKLKQTTGVRKTKEISVTEPHIMITFDKEGNNMRLLQARDLKLGDYMFTEDGISQIIKIENEKDNIKYNLVVEDGTMFANGVYVTSLCVENLKNIRIKNPITKRFNNYQTYLKKISNN